MSPLFAIAPHVLSLPPYVPGRDVASVAREFGLAETEIVKLASNESPLGVSPRGRAAVERTVAGAGRYPDSDGASLRNALAARLGVHSNWIMLGNGSSEILMILARAVLAQDRTAVVSEYAFAVYGHATRMAGAQVKVIGARDYGHDLERMARSVDHSVDMVFIANPNNPTGTYFDQQAFHDFMGVIPGRTVVVLDEAYTEYLAEANRFSSIELVRRHENLILVRTFSKAYGLAGLRVGYAVAQPVLLDIVNRVRPPYNVNILALAAAEAALGDEEFLEAGVKLTVAGRKALEGTFCSLGLRFLPSKANFILVEVGDALSVNERLLKRGIIVRPVSNYGLHTWLRVSIGLPAEQRAFQEGLAHALATSDN